MNRMPAHRLAVLVRPAATENVLLIRKFNCAERKREKKDIAWTEHVYVVRTNLLTCCAVRANANTWIRTDAPNVFLYRTETLV